MTRTIEEQRDAMAAELSDATARAEKAESALRETDVQLSRVLHELAGAASLCWEPKPTGVFDTSEAMIQVERAIGELRPTLRAALQPDGERKG